MKYQPHARNNRLRPKPHLDRNKQFGLIACQYDDDAYRETNHKRIIYVSRFCGVRYSKCIETISQLYN